MYAIQIHWSLSSLCSQYYTTSNSLSSCECEDMTIDHRQYISMKCFGSRSMPVLFVNVSYRMIEFDSCTNEFRLDTNSFVNIHLHILRFRHCHLFDVNNQTWSHIHDLEKFYVENSTMKSSSLHDVFSSNSFVNLKSLTLKHIQYDHELNTFNLERLLHQLPRLYRLELINIHLDNYRHTHLTALGQHLTYLSLANTHQTSILPLEYLTKLERLLIRQLPELFRSTTFLGSFERLNNLKYILLEHNQLRHIEQLRSTSLDDIDLSSNLIEHIHRYTFVHVPRLRQLTLTDNPLNSIDRQAFCGVEHLQRLSIHIKHRLLSPLNNCLLSDYPHLQIHQDSQTKLQCNCQLLSLLKMKHSQTHEINRLVKMNDVCFIDDQQTIDLYELQTKLNCSNAEQCSTNKCDKMTFQVKSLETDRLSNQIVLHDGKRNRAKQLLLSKTIYLSNVFVLVIVYCSL
jgi:hypothetical protein